MNQNEVNKPNVLPTFKLIIVEWFLSTTAHALPNIFRTSNIILKIIWLCCFITCSAVCIYAMSNSLKNYLAFSSYINTEIIQEIPTKFPAVTLCNLKTVNKTRSANYFYSTVPVLDPNTYLIPFQYMISQIFLTRTFISADKSLNETSRRQIGFELKDMLISCVFNYKLCDANDFTYFYDPLLGNCYTFNKGVYDNGTVYNPKTVSLSGSLYGLILELFLGDPNVDTDHEFDDGVVISIHNQSSDAFRDDQKIMAAANAETDIVVNRNFVSKLETPYGDCLKDVSNSSTFSSFCFDYIVKTLGIRYSQKQCFGLCIQKNIIDTCNCTNTLIPTFNDANNYCSPSDFPCVMELINTFGDIQASKDCKIACPFECNSIEYQVSTYRALYPTTFYKKILSNTKLMKANNVSYVDLDKALAKVNIYYKSMEYTSVTQVASTTIEQFFSDIGGTLGLYIGISILSLVEIVELGFNLIVALIGIKKNKSAVVNLSQDTNFN
jgi:hypothetical protein